MTLKIAVVLVFALSVVDFTFRVTGFYAPDPFTYAAGQ